MSQYTLYTMDNCPYCRAAKDLLERKKLSYREIRVPLDDDAQWDALEKRTGMKTMPQIFEDEKLIGGYDELRRYLK